MMIEQNAQKFTKQANSYYSKVKKKLPSYQNDLQFMNKQLNQKFKFAPCSDCSSHCSRTSWDFQRAFKTLNSLEKAEYYYHFAHLTYNFLNNVPESAIFYVHQTQRFKVMLLSNTTWKWQCKQIYIDNEQRKLTLVNEQISINLRNYILRKSRNKERKGIVLESLSSIQYIETLRLSNYDQTYEEFEKNFLILMESALRDRMTRRFGINLILTSEKSDQIEEKLSIDDMINEKALNSSDRLQVTAAFNENDNDLNLSKSSPKIKIPNSFEAIKKRIEELNHFQKFQEISPKVFFNSQDLIMRKQYDLSFNSQQQIPLAWLCDNLMNHKYFKHWKKSLTKVELLQSTHNAKTFHEIYNLSKDNRVEYTYKRTRHYQDSIIYFFDSQFEKNISPFGATIDYSITKLQKTGQQLKIVLQCKIQYEKEMTLQSIMGHDSLFLGDIGSILEGIDFNYDNDININALDFEDDFLSKIDKSHKDPQDSFYSIEDGNSNKLSDCSQIANDYQESEKIHDDHYLKVRHKMDPSSNGNQELRLPKRQGEHPIWDGQWQINDKGQMISINLEKVKAQNGVLREVFKNIGKNILSGRNILNISLPVTIFSTETNLSNICNSYSYAPLLLEAAARQNNPIHRLKYVVIFNISCAICQIQMEKPFNPILGETYQATIDECPVFGEQISHHPPISATFMKGRGFTIHGQFESKVNMGVNSATGMSDGIMNIIFDDGNSSIKYTSFAGEMSGLIFGDRKLALIGSNHYIDLKNRIYLNLKFGKHKGTTEYSKFIDGIEGKIVKVRQSANLQRFWEIKPQDVVEQYGYINGRWTGDIFYEEECLFNSWRDFPYLPKIDKNSLESDSTKRADLQERIKLNFESAQENKEDLEQIQRNDRKLREKYGPT